MADSLPAISYGPESFELVREGGITPEWAPHEQEVVLQRFASGLAVKQYMGPDGWEDLDVVIDVLGADAVKRFRKLMGPVKRQLVGFPTYGGRTTFNDVYLEQAPMQGTRPSHFTFHGQQRTRFQVRFTRLTPYSVGGAGELPSVPSDASGLVAPISLVTSSPTPSSLALIWNDPNATESGYEVQYSSDAGATWMVWGVTGPDVVSIVVDQLQAATAYSFRVRAYTPYQYGGFSPTATGTTS